MSRPLSEQVAELQSLFDTVSLACDQRGQNIIDLERKIDGLTDARDFYRTARDELIDDNATLEADLMALDQDRHRLLAERAELEAERDRLKADAISDLIKRHWLENQVRNREAERDDLQRQVQEARDEHHKFTAALGFGDGVTDPSATYDDMLEPIQRAMQDSLEHNECPIICEPCGERLADTACEHCHGSGCDTSLSRSAMAYVECEWCAGAGKIHPGCAEKSYSDLVAEVDELRAKLDRGNDDMDGHLLADSIVDAENEAVADSTPPRVITADELREGQTVATFYDDGSGSVGVVEGVDFRGNKLLSSGNVVPRYSVMEDRSVVLLEDAPQPTGYADDDHQDAEVPQWHESEPETVAAEDGIKGIFTTLLKAKKTEDERAQQVWDAWRTAFAEVYLGQDDDVTHADTRLTVHDLEVAPVGSQVEYGPVSTKRASREWGIGILRPTLSSEELLTKIRDEGALADATLTTPEGGTKHE